MRTEERIIEHAAYSRLLTEICHELNVLDITPASVDKLYVAGKRAELEEMRMIVRGWVKAIEQPERITVGLEFIPVKEGFPTEEHVVFVVTAEGSKPQRAYWQKKVVGCVESLAVNWLAWCDGVRINNVTHWAEIPRIEEDNG